MRKHAWNQNLENVVGADLENTGKFIRNDRLVWVASAVLAAVFGLILNIAVHTLFGDAPSIRSIEAVHARGKEEVLQIIRGMESRIIAVELQTNFQSRDTSRLEEQIERLNKKLDEIARMIHNSIEDPRREKNKFKINTPIPGEGVIEWPGPLPRPLPNPPRTCNT